MKGTSPAVVLVLRAQMEVPRARIKRRASRACRRPRQVCDSIRKVGGEMAPHSRVRLRARNGGPCEVDSVVALRLADLVIDAVDIARITSSGRASPSGPPDE